MYSRADGTSPASRKAASRLIERIKAISIDSEADQKERSRPKRDNLYISHELDLLLGIWKIANDFKPQYVQCEKTVYLTDEEARSLWKKFAVKPENFLRNILQLKLLAEQGGVKNGSLHVLDLRNLCYFLQSMPTDS